MELDCRGLDLVEFKADVSHLYWREFVDTNLLLQGEWKAEGAETPSKFNGIDLQEGEWYDYDEKASEEVSIKDIRWAIKRA